MSNIDDIEPDVAPEVSRESRRLAAVALIVAATAFAGYLGAVALIVLRFLDGHG